MEAVAESVQVLARPMPTIRRIELDRPWRWLEAGLRDVRATPLISLGYGLLAAVSGYLLTLGLYLGGMIYLILPLAAGFLIIGPILTVGLYEASRRGQAGQRTTLADALAAYRRNGSQIALMGMALLLLMFAWARLAALLFLLYYGLEPPSFEHLIVQTFLTGAGLPFLVIGTVVGAVLAFIAFSISAISIPLLLDREDANVVEAMATSFRAVQVNLVPMLFWGALIVVFTAAGIATLYVGLVLTLPLIGHATWHAYRDLVAFPEA